MILIISDHNDYSTSKVIDWLISFEVQWIRLNSETIGSFQLTMNENGETCFIIESEGKKIISTEITKVWYRHGTLTYLIDPKNFPTSDKIKNHINYEWKSISYYVNSMLSTLPKIGNPTKGDDLNKIELLSKAANVGFKVPQSMITDKKTELLKFIKQSNKIITKGVQRNPAFTTNGKAYFSHTKEVTATLIENTPESFFPSLFQEMIEKSYEVRVFFLKGECYAMAKFPNSSESQIDIRNVGKRKLRAVPYLLPVGVKTKIMELMKDLNLNCGSLDLIVDNNEEFYFLEVNAIGQYDALSKRCNYNLDKRIAEHLW